MAVANQRRGAPALAAEVHGASRVADAFKGRARAALPALIDGEAGAVWAPSRSIRRRVTQAADIHSTTAHHLPVGLALGLFCRLTRFPVRIADQRGRLAIEYQEKPKSLSDINYFSNRLDDRFDVIPCGDILGQCAADHSTNL